MNKIDANALELNERTVWINPVVKVVKGGRIRRFAALVVVGDGKGHVGAGLGKASEVVEAVRKAREDAKKNMIFVERTDTDSIYHDVIGKFGASKVMMRSAVEGTGLVAGGPMRAVLELAGFRNIVAKSLGSNNKNNVVSATITALQMLKSPEQVARLRGKTVEEIYGKGDSND